MSLQKAEISFNQRNIQHRGMACHITCIIACEKSCGVDLEGFVKAWHSGKQEEQNTEPCVSVGIDRRIDEIRRKQPARKSTKG